MKTSNLTQNNIVKVAAAIFPYLSNVVRCTLLASKHSDIGSDDEKRKNLFADLKQKIESTANFVLLIAALIALIIAFIQSLSSNE